MGGEGLCWGGGRGAESMIEFLGGLLRGGGGGLVTIVYHNSICRTRRRGRACCTYLPTQQVYLYLLHATAIIRYDMECTAGPPGLLKLSNT